ncbi:COG4223 family protein [Roseovarius phycicola]|uniref:Mitochondrial inner membrane protein n=1 Tax=Roseovarius phycicola TaxID=3080976 RepID=A0ABZ2HHX1_9RHOB
MVDPQTTQDASNVSDESASGTQDPIIENNLKSEEASASGDIGTDADIGAGSNADEPETSVEEKPQEEDTPVKPQEPTTAHQETESSFLPMALGGVAAGAIGFAAAFFGLAQQPDTDGAALSQKIQQIETSVGEQGETVNALTEKLDDVSAPDFSSFEGRLDEVQSALSGLLTRLETTEATLNAIDTRLTTLEKRPVTEGASQEAVAAYERELEAAAADIAQQRADLESLIASAIDTEDAAEEASKAAMRRASISRVLSALESGAPFDGALADLREAGADVPDVLSEVAGTGVTPFSELQQSFPEAARAALAIARATEGAAEGSGGLTGFLRTQLGARSLEPREGNDADAILSRAEAATRDGRLSDALSEIDALPDDAKAEFSAWSAQATERLNALRAAQDLSEALK